MGSIEAEVTHDIFPFLKKYKDGTIVRLAGTEVTPAGLDPDTNVFSEDIKLIKETGISARFYRPSSAIPGQKLPLVIYYHGGGFFISSNADPGYHHSINNIVAEANIILVSVDYRLVPECPLPAGYEDAWAALQWLATHGKSNSWLNDYADFEKVFLCGDSCGANMSHHLALKLRKSELAQELKIQGIAMIFPYFWGKDPIGEEVNDPFRKSMVDNWWLFVCPSDKGCDDPLINPFTDGYAYLEDLACDKLLVIIAEKDILKDRGQLYYDNLVNSDWKGKAEFMEIKGEDHVFHIFNPKCDNAKIMFKRLGSFFNQ